MPQNLINIVHSFTVRNTLNWNCTRLWIKLFFLLEKVTLEMSYNVYKLHRERVSVLKIYYYPPELINTRISCLSMNIYYVGSQKPISVDHTPCDINVLCKNRCIIQTFNEVAKPDQVKYLITVNSDSSTESSFSGNMIILFLYFLKIIIIRFMNIIYVSNFLHIIFG